MAQTVIAGFGKGTIKFSSDLFPIEGFCGIHDDPHARLAVIRTDESAVAILALELVNVPGHMIASYRKKIATTFLLEESQVLVHITHAITTPHEPGPKGPPDKRPAPTEEDIIKQKLFKKAVDSAVAEAILCTVSDMGSARIGIATGYCGVNVNRDISTPYGWWIGEKGDGTVNHIMTVISVFNERGIRKGVIVSFGMKPCAVDNSGMKEGKRLISSEVSGRFCARMEEEFGVPVLYCMSAGANSVPYKTALVDYVDENGKVCQNDYGVEVGFEYVDAISEEMYSAASKIIDKVKTFNVSPMRWKHISFPYPRRKGGPRELKKELTHIQDGTVEVTADVLCLGNISIISAKPEITVELEEQILKNSPFEHTILLTMTNGEMKYLPDEGGFEKGTWEAQSSMLMPGGADKFKESVCGALKELKKV